MVYGQKLKLSGSTDKDAFLAKNINITNLEVKFGGQTIAGTWEWDLEEISNEDQLWDVSVTPYTVPIYFKPSNASLANNLNKIRSNVSVNVIQGTPDTSKCGITASMYQTQPTAIYTLSSAVVNVAQNPTDPYTGAAIAGTWGWEKGTEDSGEYVINATGDYTYVFTPSSSNYKAVSVLVHVTVNKPTIVGYTVKAVESLSKPWWVESANKSEYTGGITTPNPLTGTLNGTVAAPKGSNCSNNNQDISFTLDRTKYYVSAIKVKANGYKYISGSSSVDVPYGEQYFETIVEDAAGTQYCEPSWVSISGNTNTYTVKNLLKFILAWDSIEVEVVVKSKNSSTVLSARRASAMRIDNTTSSEAESETTASTETEAQTSAPETSAPETSTPDTETETSAPETNAPETSAPETSAPETSAPETESETSAPETTAPETTAPETSAPAETEAQVSPQSETSAPATEAQTSAPETDPPAAEADEAA